MKKISKAQEQRELKLLARKCLFLWKTIVKERAGRRCEICGKKKRLQSHHIESYSTNKGLRFSKENGMCLCITDHKFGRLAAHKSFCTMYNAMTTARGEDLIYLLAHYTDKVELTKKYLQEKIKELEIEVESYTKKKGGK